MKVRLVNTYEMDQFIYLKSNLDTMASAWKPFPCSPVDLDNTGLDDNIGLTQSNLYVKEQIKESALHVRGAILECPSFTKHSTGTEKDATAIRLQSGASLFLKSARRGQ